MQSKNSFYRFYSFIILAIFILPLIYISKFVILVSDDLCRASSISSNFFDLIIDWYKTHNGRFVNSILSFLPVYELDIYRSVIVLFFLIIGFCLYDFLKRLFRIYGIKVSKSENLLLASIFYVILVAELPSLFEFFYWYAAGTVYLLSFVAFTYFTLILIRVYHNLKWNFWLSLFLVVFLNGNNELFLGFTNLMLLGLLFREIFQRRKICLKLIILNIVSWVTSLVFILSPGTLMRRAGFGYDGDILISSKVAIIYGGRFILENLIELPNLLFLASIFLFLQNSKLNNRISNYINPLVLLVISYVAIITFYGLKFYGTGLVQRDVGRVGNILHLVALVFFVVNTINFSVFLKKNKNFGFHKARIFSNVLILILLVFLLIKNKNYVDLRLDFVEGNFQRFEEDIGKRKTDLKKVVGETLAIDEIENTRILKAGDKILIAEEWLRKCYLEKVNNDYDKSFKNLKIN